MGRHVKNPETKGVGSAIRIPQTTTTNRPAGKKGQIIYNDTTGTFQVHNGANWYNFDPSKWIIKILSLCHITYSLKKVPDYLIIKAKIDTLNKKIKNLAGYMDSKSIYRNKINEITIRASKNLSLWKKLDKKYDLIKESKNSNNQYTIYKKQINIYKLELQQSISSLLLLLINIKSLS